MERIAAVKLLKKVGWMSFWVLVGFTLVFSLFLLGCQNRVIYFPREYDAGHLMSAPKNMAVLNFKTSQGEQVAFYIPPRASVAQPPATIWLVCGGNGSLALDWLEFVENFPASDTGFLLLDYPGYGNCMGKPSPKTILESSEGAVDALAAHLDLRRPELEDRVAVLGHSIGAAAGLNYAVVHPVEKVVLVSPFTSLRDMARRRVGWPLCYLLLHNYDNRARLGELAKRDKPPSVSILHGTNDEIIPVAMGRELAELYPDMIAFQETPHADHNWILSVAEKQIHAAMMK